MSVNITAQMVSDLRNRTGAGIASCKNALVECKGDMEAAIVLLRKKGEADASKKADRATAESDRAFTLRLRDRERKLIKKIQQALTRIEEGEFGVCVECGEEIGTARLKARPMTTLCINCKSKQEEDEMVRGD